MPASRPPEDPTVSAVSPLPVAGRAARVLAAACVFVLVLAGALFFARDLGGGEVQHWDAFFTLDRSQGFLRTGDWLSVTSNHAPANQKPPLQYYLTAILLGSGVDPVLAIRVWPFLLTLGTLLLTGLLARLAAPDRPWAAPAAVALVASPPLLWATGRMGLLDSGQAFFVVATLCAVLLARRSPRWWIAAGLLAGLGALQKSPVAVLFALLSLAGLGWFDRGGSYAWSRVRRLPAFRTGAILAVGLTLAWPLLQAVCHGVEFLGPYFGKQIFRRFQPANPFSEDTAVNPLRWVPWLLEGAPVAAGLCLLLLVLALLVPRLRVGPAVKALGALVVFCFVLLSVAGGQIYDRYLLAVWPLLAVVGGATLAAVLPAAGLPFLVAGLALAASTPELARVPDRPYAVDRSEIRRVCERFVADLRAEETPVFVSPPPGEDFPPGAFLVYTALDRPALMLSGRRWDLVGAKVAERDFQPPYLGVCHGSQVEDAQRHLPGLAVVETVGEYVLWRVPRPGP